MSEIYTRWIVEKLFLHGRSECAEHFFRLSIIHVLTLDSEFEFCNRKKKSVKLHDDMNWRKTSASLDFLIVKNNPSNSTMIIFRALILRWFEIYVKMNFETQSRQLNSFKRDF